MNVHVKQAGVRQEDKLDVEPRRRSMVALVLTAVSKPRQVHACNLVYAVRDFTARVALADAVCVVTVRDLMSGHADAPSPRAPSQQADRQHGTRRAPSTSLHGIQDRCVFAAVLQRFQAEIGQRPVRDS